MQCLLGVQIRCSSSCSAASDASVVHASSGDEVGSCAIVRSAPNKIKAVVRNVVFMAATGGVNAAGAIDLTSKPA